VCTGESGGAFDRALARVRIGKRDVRGDRIVEEQRVLEYHANSTTQFVERKIADRHTVDRDRAGIGLVKADQ
jgi:hypothetical protein